MIDSIPPGSRAVPNASHCVCHTASAGSIDSTASRILAFRLSVPLEAVLIRSLQLIQALGMSAALY